MKCLGLFEATVDSILLQLLLLTVTKQVHKKIEPCALPIDTRSRIWWATLAAPHFPLSARQQPGVIPISLYWCLQGW